MADFISFQPSDYFNTKLYTGTGASNAQTGLGFQPDMTWLKSRSATTSHYLFDSARGATKAIFPDLTDTEATNAEYLKSFDSDGFTVGTNAGINDNTATYAGWNWKAGTTSGVDFSSGDITPTAYSINTTSGIGIYHYTCTGANATMVHGLSSAPKMLITKSLGDTAAWAVWHTGLTDATKYLVLNTTASEATNANAWNSTAPSSSVISFGSDGQTNGSGKNNIMYAFSDVKGYSSFGTFTGTASATDGAFIYTGFRPAYVLVKAINYTAAWIMFDSKRLGYNLQNKVFTPNTTSVEEAAWMSDIYSNGFKPFSSDPAINGAYNYVYAAFAEFPIVSSNSKAGTAR